MTKKRTMKQVHHIWGTSSGHATIATKLFISRLESLKKAYYWQKWVFFLATQNVMPYSSRKWHAKVMFLTLCSGVHRGFGKIEFLKMSFLFKYLILSVSFLYTFLFPYILFQFSLIFPFSSSFSLSFPSLLFPFLPLFLWNESILP